MDASTTNEEICNYHFLKIVENGSTAITTTTTSLDQTMDSELNFERAESNEVESQKWKERKEKMIADDQKSQLIEILLRKDHIIQNLSDQLKHLEAELQLTAAGKWDALARLEKIEGKEQALMFREKKMDGDVVRLNIQITSLTDDLNENRKELAAVRQEFDVTKAQFDIDINANSEQLRFVNAHVAELSESNQLLQIKNEEYANKLNQQLNASSKLIKAYDDELEAKTTLAELYKENNVDYQAQADELTAGIVELKKFLDETLDAYGILETKLKECELIAQLRQELKDANLLLNEENDGSSERDTENGNETSNNPPHSIDHLMTFTELYSRYQEVVKQLKEIQFERAMYEAEIPAVMDDVKKKAIDFDKQQKEF